MSDADVSNLFEVWTEVPLLHGKTAVGLAPSQGVTFREPETNNKIQLLGERDWAKYKSHLLTRAKAATVGVGIVNKYAWRPDYAKRVQDGLVITAEARGQGRPIYTEYGEDNPWRENNLIVYVVPLWWHYGVARFGISPAIKQDYRLNFLYFRRCKWSTTQDELDVLERVAHKLPIQCHPIELTEEETGYQYWLVRDGEFVDNDNYCETCPKLIQWSLGRCAFAKYQCVVGTHFDNAENIPNPNYDRFFGNNHAQKADCIDRDSFEAYYASNITVQLNTRTKQAKKLLKNAAGKAARTRRLKLTLCAACPLSKLNESKCQRSPHYCWGPFTEDELANGFHWKPWQFHTFSLSMTVVPARLANQLIPTVSKLKADFHIKRPISRAMLNEFCKNDKKLTKRLHCSNGSQHDHELVLVGRHNSSDKLLVFGYKELCGALGITPVHTEDELRKAWPVYDRLAVHAKFILSWECGHVFRPLQKVLRAVYIINPNKIELLVKQKKQYWSRYDLTHGDTVHTALGTLLSQDQRVIKEELKTLVKDGAIISAEGVVKYLNSTEE